MVVLEEADSVFGEESHLFLQCADSVTACYTKLVFMSGTLFSLFLLWCIQVEYSVLTVPLMVNACRTLRSNCFLHGVCMFGFLSPSAALDTFFIEVDFIGTWTNARRAIFQSAADR